MNFSLILNSRKRPRFLLDFIKSVENGVEDKSKVEILVRIDEDDQESLKLAEYRFNFNIDFYCGERPKNLHKTINELAFEAKGKNIFVCNDDMRITTKSWDSIIVNKIEEYKKNNNIKDNIYYCKTNCNSADRDHAKGYCSFPIISKEAVETIGFFMHDSFVGLGADHGIYRVYKSINRIIDLQEIKIDHILHRTIEDVMKPDLTALEMRNNSSANWVNPESLDLSDQVTKLKNKINEKI